MGCNMLNSKQEIIFIGGGKNQESLAFGFQFELSFSLITQLK